MVSKFIKTLWKYNDILCKENQIKGWFPIYECFMTVSYKPPFDTHLQCCFPVLEGTPHAKEHLLSPIKVQLLGILSQIPYEHNLYEKKIDDLINIPMSRDIFKDYSLYLLKEHCKLFMPYNEKLKTLLQKLEQLGDDGVPQSDRVKAAELLKQFKQQNNYPILLKDVFNLQRFINAQDYGGGDDSMSTYQKALEEIKSGCKKTHWIWYIFPQMKGLGHSKNSEFYGISGREEAYAYMEDPILSSRLIEATEAVLNNKHTVYEIFGSDTIKFRSCMLLFSTISDNPIFKQVIHKYHW